MVQFIEQVEEQISQRLLKATKSSCANVSSNLYWSHIIWLWWLAYAIVYVQEYCMIRVFSRELNVLSEMGTNLAHNSFRNRCCGQKSLINSSHNTPNSKNSPNRQKILLEKKLSNEISPKRFHQLYWKVHWMIMIIIIIITKKKEDDIVHSLVDTSSLAILLTDRNSCGARLEMLMMMR